MKPERATVPIPRAPATVRGHGVQVARGGKGAPILLIHGGWAGAQMHWGRVWSRLIESHDVVAPDLPGLGAVNDEPLGSVADYAGWLVELLDALSVDRTALVGNSFGASVAWAMAGRYPDRCSALVLVDGFPMPRTPAPLGLLAKVPGTRRLACALIRHFIYTEANVARAFAHLGNVPSDLRRAVKEDWPVIVPRYVDILIAGDGSPSPELAPLLVFGDCDRLPGSQPRDATRWHNRLVGSSLRVVKGAGHFPQIEAPDAFADILEEFLSKWS